MVGKLAVCILLLGWTAPVAAAPVELLFAKGVVAFSQGKLDEASEHFRQVLAEDPAHVQARAYLGQVELGRDRPDLAVEHLERALKLEPDNGALLLDLALALIKLERFGEAEQRLSGFAGGELEQAAFQYYLGHCRYKSGRYALAVEPLERARDLDGGFGAAAVYTLGLVHARLGDREQALAQFESLTGPGGQQQLVELARDNMEFLQGFSAAKSWGLFAALGGGYDSNVALSTVDTADAGAGGLFVALGASWRAIESQRQRLQLELRAFRSFHFSEATEGFNLTDLALALEYRRSLAPAWQLMAAYHLDVDLLDDLAVVGLGEGFGLFMHGHQGLVGLSWRWSRQAETGLRYGFQAAFFGMDTRNHFAHELLWVQDLSFFDSRLHVAVGAGVALEDAKGLDWDLWGPVASLAARWQILEPLQFSARLDFRREDHHNFDAAWLPGERRVDNLLSLGVGLSWSFDRRLSLGLNYRVLRNLADSVDLPMDPFSYDRHSVSLVFTGRL